MAQATFGISAFKKGDLIAQEFEVVAKLGEGGCGSVYHCRWSRDAKREVAVKMLDQAGDLQRFIREAKVLRRTRHDNVVKLLGSGFHDKQPYIALEYMEGGSIRDLMDERGKFPVDEAAWILIQSIRGLRAAKAVHRDLKPENLLIGRSSGKTRSNKVVVGDIAKGIIVKVADFGLARQLDIGDTRLTNSGQVMGTPVYMSPEQCRSTKKVTERTDIYALGIIFYEMITGKVPFDGSNAYDIMRMHVEEEPKFPRMDKGVRAVIARCLEKSPSKRYPSLFALEKDLAKLAGVSEPKPDGLWSLVAIILLSLALLGTVGWLLRDRLF
jgi:eukaryotic-like serine/threonine-protein kinase